METKSGKVLVADDNIQILNALHILLKSEFEEVITLRHPHQILPVLQTTAVDVILLDMNFKAGINNGNEGIYWLKEILMHDPQAAVIMITAYGDIDLAVKAIKEGAIDFISKPWDAEKLIVTIKSALALRRSRQEVNRLKGKQKQLIDDIHSRFKLVKGPSRSMTEIYKTLDKVAGTHANVLIMGENGTGKELIAREIHQKSTRSAEVFLGVDLASLSENLFESEVFGHQKGSFTDAREDRPGRFETASGGTLFLDEIGNLPLNLQGKLLTVLQNRQITRIGSNKPVPVDIRLITATNKPLEMMVKENLFREDLFYRINTIQIHLPPLRERKEDIPVLASFFLAQHANRYNKSSIAIDKNAFRKLQEYAWPGNIRELDHTIEKAVILSDKGVLHAEDFYLQDRSADLTDVLSPKSLSEIEKMAIRNVLNQCQGNYSKAAQILNISRTTLYTKIEKYKI